MILKTSLLNFIFLFLFSLLVHAEETSGAGSAKAKAKDAAESQAIIEQVEAASETGSTKETKEWIPSAEKYDWLQLTSNEWLKGEIKGMYKDSLEFDSDKLDLLEIDWEALGLDASSAEVVAPDVSGLQSTRSYPPGGHVTVPAGKGLFLILE